MDNNYSTYKQLVGGGAKPNDATCREICNFLNELMKSLKVTPASKSIIFICYLIY
jgi:hypothetical protein